MSTRSLSHRPRQDWRALRDVSPTRVNIKTVPPYIVSRSQTAFFREKAVWLRETSTSHLVPSMDPIVSFVASHGRQNPL